MTYSLSEHDPKNGDVVHLKGVSYEVTSRDTYKNDDGYRVIEWCLETDDTENYLLKEFDKGGMKWFFTRWQTNDSVTLPDGTQLHEVLHGVKDMKPPTLLLHGGVQYGYDDTTEGTDEDDDGNKVDKTTWDYWDAAHQKNLAVEIWADGGVDFYLGYYIKETDVSIDPGAAKDDDDDGDDDGADLIGLVGSFYGSSPFLAILTLTPVIAGGLWVFLDGDVSFDACVAIAAFISFSGALLQLAAAYPSAGWLCGISGVCLVPVYFNFHPITHPLGLATLVLVPALVRFMGAKDPGDPAGRDILVAAAVGMPAAVVGLDMYFNYAPAPNTTGQFVVALVPALAAAAAAWALSRFVFSRTEAA